jgi:two-component system response regulator TctD
MQTTLQRSFERRGMQVVLCGDGARALDRWRASLPDVVLLDLSLPGLDGLQVLAAARAEGLTDAGAHPHRARHRGRPHLGLNTGADDYLAKPFDLDELEARVRALARRRGAAPPAPLWQPSSAACAATRQRRGLPARPAAMELTAREAALLRALLARPGQAVAKERLSELVFPGEAEVQADAIEVVVYRLRKKLAAHRRRCSWSPCAAWATC